VMSSFAQECQSPLQLSAANDYQLLVTTPLVPTAPPWELAWLPGYQRVLTTSLLNPQSLLSNPQSRVYYPTRTVYYPTRTDYYPTRRVYYPTRTVYYPTRRVYYPTRRAEFTIQPAQFTIQPAQITIQPALVPLPQHSFHSPSTRSTPPALVPLLWPGIR